MSLEEMFPTLTVARCDCCGESLVDPVALTAVCDAVRGYRDALVEKHDRDQAAWQDAYAAIDAAKAGAHG